MCEHHSSATVETERSVMGWSGRLLRGVVLPVTEAVIGRRNLVRLGRLISMEARLDSANDMAGNGERLVQKCLLRHAGERKVVAFDVGANIGEWTESLLRLAGSAPTEVHLF